MLSNCSTNEGRFLRRSGGKNAVEMQKKKLLAIELKT